MQVGYIGLGKMGGALAARLQKTLPLLVYDRSEQAIAALVDQGARAAPGLPDLAAACDVILICLPTSDFVREVIFGEDGLDGHLRPGTLIIDQTTGDPAETREMSARLAEAGIHLIDAPVSGGLRGAAAGTIAIMVGAAEPQFDAAMPVLGAISSNIFHAGDVGSGHVMKLVNNLMSTTQRLLSFEAMTLAAKCGVDPAVAAKILTSGGGSNAFLQRSMTTRILEGRLNSGFTLDLAHKDVRLACDMGEEAGVPTMFGNLTRELYQLCREEMGGDAQIDTIGLYFDRLAGTQVVPPDHDLDDGRQ